MNKKMIRIAGWALGLSMAVAGIGLAVGTSHLVSGNAPTMVKADTVNLDFSWTSMGSSGWGSSYAEHSKAFTDGTVYFSNASKQTNSITDVPVQKGGTVSFVLTDNTKAIENVAFACRQWGTKSQTITLKYSTDSGESYSTLSPSVTSTNFSISKNNLPTGTNAVQISFSSGSNQVGIVSMSYDLATPAQTITKFTAELKSGTYYADHVFTQNDFVVKANDSNTAHYDIDVSGLNRTELATSNIVITYNKAGDTISDAIKSVNVPVTFAKENRANYVFSNKSLAYVDGFSGFAAFSELGWTSTQEANAFDSSNGRGPQFGAAIGEFTVTLPAVSGYSITNVSILLSSNNTGNTIGVSVGTGANIETFTKNGDGSTTSFSILNANHQTVSFAGNGSGALTLSVNDANKSVWITSVSLTVTIDTDVVTAFVTENMKMSEYTADGTYKEDRCTANYAAAKAAYEELNYAQKKLFATDPTYSAAATRFGWWAAANGDTFNASTGVLSAAHAMNFGLSSAESTMPLVVTVAILGTAAAAGFFIFQRKRKEN